MKRVAGLMVLTAGAVFAFPNPDGGCTITTGATVAPAVKGVAYSITIATSGCAAPIRFLQLATGTLPPGLVLTSSSIGGTISGTPTAAGVYAFALRAVDLNYNIPSKSFVLRVNDAMRIDTPALATGVSGAAYSDTVRARGGVAPYAFTVVQGSLPAGLTLNASTGVIAGLMPAAGTQFRVRVTDSSQVGNFVEKSFTIVQGAQVTTVGTPPVGSVGTAYSFDIDGSLGVGGFSLGLGALPGGLLMDTNGVVSGTPTTAGEYHFTVRQTVGFASAWRSYRIFVNSAATITGTPRDAEEAFAYDHVFGVTGGVAPYTFSVSGGALPSGITLDGSTGALLGELPVGSNGTAFTISALDASGRTYSRPFSITRAFRLVGGTTTPPAVRINVSGSATPYTLTQGGSGKQFTMIGGTGRGFITLNSGTGGVTYQTGDPGNYSPVVLGSDALGGAVVLSNRAGFTVVGNLAIDGSTELPNARSGVPYNSSVSVLNGDFTPLTFSVSGGFLPYGLTLNTATGAITGTSTLVEGNAFAFTITVQDADGQTASRNYFIGLGGLVGITTNYVPGGTIGVGYNFALSPSGASGVSWVLGQGTLPPGVDLTRGGVLTGTPTTAGAYTFQAILSAAATGASDTKEFTINVAPAMTATIAPASALEATEGLSASAVVTPAGGRTPVTLSLTAGNLPEGLYLKNSAPIGIAGVAELATSASFTILVTDADGRSVSIPYVVNVRKALKVSTLTLGTATRTVPYSQVMAAAGGRTPYTWSLNSGSLPTGLTISSAGVISGTPTVSATFSPQILVQDADGRTDLVTYTMNVRDPLVVTNAVPLPGVLLLTPYSAQITTTGGDGSNTYSISSGDLPGLLALDPAQGFIANVPLVQGTYSFTVRVEDSAGRVGSLAEQLSINQTLTITPAAVPNGTVGAVYSQALGATNSIGLVAWSVTAGALPGGLTLGASTGIIGGTPTTAGNFAFTVSAVDGQNQMGQRAYTMTVLDPLAVTTTTLADATQGEAYTAALGFSGTGSGLGWSITAGALPAGLTLSASTGVISGTPTTFGAFGFTVQAANTASQAATRVLSLLVVERLTVTTLTLGRALQGRSYAATLTSNGGRGPFTWALSGVLPAGLVLNPSTGQISGVTNVAEGAYPQNVMVTDSRGRSATGTVGLDVEAPPPPPLIITPETLPGGRVNEAYSASVTASGGVPGYTFSLAQGAMPPGLQFAGGAISGRPTQEGTFRFTVNATDSRGQVAGNLYTMVIDAALLPLVLTPSAIPTTTQIGQPFGVQFGATGGRAPYTFAVSGNMPPGTSSNTSGLLSGTPSQGGTFTFVVEVTDSVKGKASRTYTVTVTGNLTITTTPPLAEGTVGASYGVTFGGAGGRAPYTWSMSGSGPGGLSFDGATGSLTGTASAAGTFPFTVEVRDSQRMTATAAYSITIYERLEITNGPGETALVSGAAYAFGFAARGGKAPVTFAVSGGTLPAGLSLLSTGEISGTPTAAGTSSFTIRATDALGNVAAREATLRVVAGLTVTTSGLPAGVVGTAYSAGLAASGGVAPLGAWSITQGALPAGLTLAADGAITGVPSAAGNAAFTVRITDGAGTAATRALSINIGLPALPPVVISGLPQTLPPGTQTIITIQLAQPFPVTVTGVLTLLFEPDAVNNADDPSVQFSSGGRTVTFTIPAGQTVGTFAVNPVRLLSGTVAGTIRIRTTTLPASATPVPDATVPIARLLPVITAGTAQLGTGAFTLVIDGYSNTREISAATFRLTAATGAPLATTEVPVAVLAAFTSWYQSAAAAPFGGQFRLTMPFTVTGSLGDIESVAVTVTNSVGTSLPFSVRLR